MWGPSNVTTMPGKRWFMTFIDDQTCLCWIYLMREKSEVEKLFKDFYNMIENQFQTKISILILIMEHSTLMSIWGIF